MPFDYREIYCPAHFGNSYEVMWPREMRAVLAEAQVWGFNAYGDWFDFADLKSPWNNPKKEFLMPQALWERKIAHFKSAKSLGLKTDLVITPNQVFLDQLSDPLRADFSESRFWGQLLCPSKAEGREIILDNYRRLFADLLRAGVQLDSLCAFAFDYGGCGCDQCRPWIVTFGKLYRDIHDLAQEYFPGIAARLVGWWWTKEEHDLFRAWAEREAPGRFVSLAAHIRYGETAPDTSFVLPQGCQEHAFVHIGYGDVAEPRDTYGPWGPVVAPERMAQTVKGLSAMGINGVMAYSEGVFDDVNKALLAGLASGRFASAEDLLAAYVERYFGARGATRQAWAAWLAQWGSPWEVDTAAARREFERLNRGVQRSWRLLQWEGKLRLYEDHAAVLARTDWDAARLAAAERFFADREWLERGVWGLGLVRHCLNDHFWPPSWYAEWEALQAQGTSGAGTMPKEA